MFMRPARLIASGHALGLVAGAGAFAFGAGLVAAGLTAWIGGAFATLALAVHPATRARFAAPDDAASDAADDAAGWRADAALQAALRGWEEDRRLDAGAGLGADIRMAGQPSSTRHTHGTGSRSM